MPQEGKDSNLGRRERKTRFVEKEIKVSNNWVKRVGGKTADSYFLERYHWERIRTSAGGSYGGVEK